MSHPFFSKHHRDSTAHVMLHLQENLPIGDPTSKKNVSKKKKKLYSTPFGTGDVLTVGAMVAQMWLLITSFFTDAINGAILSEFSGEEVLGIMFLVVFLWFSIAPTLRRIAETVPAEGLGWRMVWVMAVDFFSRLVLLIAFGYAAIFLKMMWIRESLTLVEILFTTAVLAMYGFAFYAYVLMYERMKEKVRAMEDYNPV